MDNETAIHIATKVWGMTSSQMAKEYSWEHNNCNFNEAGAQTYSQYWESQVNSWQGFGRTVEAMAKRNMYPFMNEDWDILFFHRDDLGAAHRPRFTYSNSNINSIIEATHLSALEAGREGK